MNKIYPTFLASVIFLSLLFGTYWTHVTYFKVNVVLYDAITDGVVATIGAVAVLLLSQKFKIFNRFEKLQFAVIWLLASYVLAISIPTLIDRSLSFYILEKLQQRGGAIQLARFEEVFTKEYVKEHRLVDVRLTEQKLSGTIRIENGCVSLTTRGEALVKFSQFFRVNFLPKQRLLMGSYSDDLVDPFRHSAESPDYKCH